MTSKIFIDTSYIVALFVPKDQYHEQAKKVLPMIDKKEKIMCQSVINETIALINKKAGVDASKRVYKAILDNFTVITEDMELYNDSMDTLIKYHKLSLTDSIIVNLMKKDNIIEIASFDDDFDRVNGIVRIH
ncbi:tRNA(fMet)-specific endonuclease VapC [Methanobrevibacter cuticularis]|uniref:tRNA(FMet)-specific endonuclease VapC n=1 Tax=Methanobrevibacter cuticularis TaxID=47311 RepID=A0A166DNX3_9EURY|nr:PIN domain-containing protein [Methanobrevibacter cuticularis]KZX15802.1 tRNA(fMet)-specific endonuclease VapC [Methanobrevibacter cuticularis]